MLLRVSHSEAAPSEQRPASSQMPRPPARQLHPRCARAASPACPACASRCHGCLHAARTSCAVASASCCSIMQVTLPHQTGQARQVSARHNGGRAWARRQLSLTRSWRWDADSAGLGSSHPLGARDACKGGILHAGRLQLAGSVPGAAPSPTSYIGPATGLFRVYPKPWALTSRNQGDRDNLPPLHAPRGAAQAWLCPRDGLAEGGLAQPQRAGHGTRSGCCGQAARHALHQPRGGLREARHHLLKGGLRGRDGPESLPWRVRAQRRMLCPSRPLELRGLQLLPAEGMPEPLQEHARCALEGALQLRHAMQS